MYQSLKKVHILFFSIFFFVMGKSNSFLSRGTCCICTMIFFDTKKNVKNL